MPWPWTEEKLLEDLKNGDYVVAPTENICNCDGHGSNNTNTHFYYYNYFINGDTVEFNIWYKREGCEKCIETSLKTLYEEDDLYYTETGNIKLHEVIRFDQDGYIPEGCIGPWGWYFDDSEVLMREFLDESEEDMLGEEEKLKMFSTKNKVRKILGHNEVKLKDIVYELTAKYSDKLVNTGDTERDHNNADAILCELLLEMGFKELVDKYEAIDKWYA